MNQGISRWTGVDLKSGVRTAETTTIILASQESATEPMAMLWHSARLRVVKSRITAKAIKGKIGINQTKLASSIIAGSFLQVADIGNNHRTARPIDRDDDRQSHGHFSSRDGEYDH